MKMSNLKTIITVIIAYSLIVYAPIVSSAADSLCPPTQNDVEGPYYVPDAPFRTNIADRDQPGERVVIKGTVLHTDCKSPVKDALVEVWQTDSQGKYHYRDEGYKLRGQMRTDDNGHFEFSSIKPGRYRIMNGFRPAHIHFKVSHPGYDVLITQLYFQGDPYLWPNDACGRGCRSSDPKRIIELKPHKHDGIDILKGTFPVFLKKCDKKVQLWKSDFHNSGNKKKSE
jgi:catechol 1,2-dioxygenase